MSSEKILNAAVIGAGSWGTSIAVVMAEATPSINIKMWAYEKSVVESINSFHENTEFLPGIHLPYQITATNNLREAVENAEVIIIGTPSKVLPDTAQKLNRVIRTGTMVGFLTKGFCKIDDEVLTVSQTIEKYIPSLKNRVVAISGPSHAEEVSKRFHTCLNVAGKNPSDRKIIARLLTCSYMQCREKDDIIGVEVGGTLKNPAAIAAGIISVLPGCGDNLAGALISEALKEMILLGKSFRAKDETIIDISGLGDLVATALSSHSRNRRFGQDIASQIMEKSTKVNFRDRVLLKLNPRAVIERMGERLNYLAEGAYAIEPLIELAAEKDIPVPVYRSLYEVLLNKKDPVLLIETIKNPGRYEELYRQTKIHITEKKKGLEKVKGRVFRKLILKRVINSVFTGDEEKDKESRIKEKIAEYTNSLKGSDDRKTRKEAELMNALLSDFSTSNVEAAVKFYIGSMVDNFSSSGFKTLMFFISLGRILASSPFNRKKLQIEGDMYKLSSLSDLGNMIYILGNSGPFDFLGALKSIRRMQLPVPRFMVVSEALSGPFEASWIRSAGGFIVDEKKYGNPLYRTVFSAYICTLIENGVPLLLSRYYDQTNIPEELLQSIKQTVTDHSVEVIIAPVSLAKTIRTDADDRKGIFPVFPHLKGGMIYRFSEFIYLSEFTREDNQTDRLLPVLENEFKKDRPWYAHVLMAKVFLANGNSIPKDQTEQYAMDFMENQGMVYQGKTKKMVGKGISWLKRKKIIRRADRQYIVEKPEELQKLADMF